MTNKNTGEMSALEIHELKDEELKRVAAGADEAIFEYLCPQCGATLINYDTPCAVCGNITECVGMAEIRTY